MQIKTQSNGQEDTIHIQNRIGFCLFKSRWVLRVFGKALKIIMTIFSSRPPQYLDLIFIILYLIVWYVFVLLEKRSVFIIHSSSSANFWFIYFRWLGSRHCLCGVLMFFFYYLFFYTAKKKYYLMMSDLNANIRQW